MTDRLTFTGEIDCKIGGKSRFNLPKKFNTEANKFGLIKATNSPVIVAFPLDGSEKNFSDAMMSFLTVVKMDNQRRLHIPKKLREHINLTPDNKDITLVGQGNHFDIMTGKTWGKLEDKYALKANEELRKMGWQPPEL